MNPQTTPIRVAIFSCSPNLPPLFSSSSGPVHFEFQFITSRLTPSTSDLAYHHSAVVLSPRDFLPAPDLADLASHGLRVVALRCPAHHGQRTVDVAAASDLGVAVVALEQNWAAREVAEYVIGTSLALARGVWTGVDCAGAGVRTVGIVGVGRVGGEVARMFRGMGTRVLGYDKVRRAEMETLGVEYVDDADILVALSDVISVHLTARASTHGIIGRHLLGRAKHGAVLVNTASVGLCDLRAVIDGLESGQLRGFCQDLYDHEEGIFPEDPAAHTLLDDNLNVLRALPNAVVTEHRAASTVETLTAMVDTTLNSIGLIVSGEPCSNAVAPLRHEGTESPHEQHVTMVGKFYEDEDANHVHGPESPGARTMHSTHTAG